MNKLAYALGVQAACEQLGLKTAAPVSAVQSMPSAPKTMTAPKPPTWGLGGKTPGGFQAQTATPGPAPGVQAVPLATPASRGGPSPAAPMPALPPPIGTPNVSGVTNPSPSNDITGAMKAPAAGTRSAAPKASTGGSDVADVAARTGGSPFSK
jgi:hypothetical protein